MKTSWPDNFPVHIMGRSLGSSGLSSFAIALEAWRRGLEVTFTSVDLYLYEISDGDRSVSFNFSRPDSITRREDYLRLNRKGETIAMLHEEGIPAPRGYLLKNSTSMADLKTYADSLGYPLVLKPNSGSMGQGVLSGIKDWDELNAGFEYLSTTLRTQEILLEKHHTGDDYRVLVVGDQVIGAVLRVPAHIVGNGKSTVAELISAKNLSRKWNPFLTSGLIKVDFEVTKCLSEQNLELSGIPRAGKRVHLRRVANASAGGDVVDVTDTLPEEIKNAAVRAVQKFPRILIAGVDVLYRTGEPATQDNYVIIEMNSRPQIGVNMYPTDGKGRDVPKAVIDTLFPGTRRPASSLLKSIKFNERAIRIAIRSGIASKITLPILPEHYFPFRQKYVFRTNGKQVEFRQYAERTMQKIARTHGVSGSLKVSTVTGNVELRLAAESAQDAEPIIKAAALVTSTVFSISENWNGPVVLGFTVTK